MVFEDMTCVVAYGWHNKQFNHEGDSFVKKRGVVKDSVIKVNYIFTISEKMIGKILFHLSDKKKKIVFDELTKYLSGLML